MLEILLVVVVVCFLVWLGRITTPPIEWISYAAAVIVAVWAVLKYAG